MAVNSVSGVSGAAYATMANATRGAGAPAAAAVEAGTGLRPESVEGEKAETGLDFARKSLEAAKQPQGSGSSDAPAKAAADAAVVSIKPASETEAGNNGAASRPKDGLGTLLDITV